MSLESGSADRYGRALRQMFPHVPSIAVSLHPILSAAAEGELPSWTAAGPARREHMARVSGLLRTWAEAAELTGEDRVRWSAVGYLHDVLREAPPAELRTMVPPEHRGLPDPLLHGPAGAERLRVAGILDGEVLTAVAWHTTGDVRFGALGRALYAADFLEPGRSFLPEWREELRDRMPGEADDVVREIVGARITNLVSKGRPVMPRTLHFWNLMSGESR